jgi:cell fate regulator YaaT (PSP1 superfamily)
MEKEFIFSEYVKMLSTQFVERFEIKKIDPKDTKRIKQEVAILIESAMLE